jgi:hypothetical protein
MTPDEFVRLHNYREALFSEIKRTMDIYGHWKSFEGEIALKMPGLCNEFDGFTLIVLCYVASADEAGSRHEYRGKTLGECVTKAEADLIAWKFETDEWVKGKTKNLNLNEQYSAQTQFDHTART